MKAIILISSIFYILGLKIGNKIDLTPSSDVVKTIITPKISTKKSSDTFEYKPEAKSNSKSDSVKINNLEKQLPENSK